MRNYIAMLFGSFALLLASACSRPAPPALPSTPIECYFHEPAATRVDSDTDAPSREQVQASQVAVLTSEVVAPKPRFYTRWRRVHGRWYHFTYQRGKRHAVVYELDAGRYCRGFS